DDRADVGVELSSPLGAETIGDFSEHDAGTQRAFGAVVGRWNVAVRHEDEEILPRPLDDALELDASLMGRHKPHEFVEAGIEPRGIVFQGRVGEPFSSPPDPAGSAQQMPKLGREDVVAGVRKNEADKLFLVKRIKRIAIHSQLESTRDSAVKLSQPRQLLPNSNSARNEGREQLR